MFQLLEKPLISSNHLRLLKQKHHLNQNIVNQSEHNLLKVDALYGLDRNIKKHVNSILIGQSHGLVWRPIKREHRLFQLFDSNIRPGLTLNNLFIENSIRFVIIFNWIIFLWVSSELIQLKIIQTSWNVPLSLIHRKLSLERLTYSFKHREMALPVYESNIHLSYIKLHSY